MTPLASKSLFDGLSLKSMSSKKAAMGIDPNAVTQTPTSSKLDVSSATSSSPLLTISPNHTKQNQNCELSAQQVLSLARRRLLYAQTIARFESHFQYPLWESEKEHLAHLLQLQVERPVRNEGTIQDVFSFLQRAQDSIRVAQSDARNKREIRDGLNSEAAMEDERDTTGYRKEAAEEEDDSEVDDIEDKEAEEALRWLEMEWESLAKTLMKTDTETHWDEGY